MRVFVGFPDFAGRGTIERGGRRQRNACEPAAAARSFRVGFYLALMEMVPGSRQLNAQLLTPKILPILVENRDMPDWEVDFGPERGSLARVEL